MSQANNISYVSPQEFPILPWGWTPSGADTLAGIYHCGFNLAGFVRPADLDAIAAAGLQGIVFDESTHVTDTAAGLDDAGIERRVAALVGQVRGHPALYGYYLRDEPGAAVYPGLARWSRAFHAADPQARVYINLFPNYATPEQLNAPDYAAYVRGFLEQVAPPFLSYDHYALMEDGSLRSLYFPNLAAIRAAAVRAGLPFWNIILSNTHFQYAEPSPAGLHFQVYTSLAYGARGISYFTYFTPDVGNYRLAPVDPFGFTTPTWEMVRSVNMQIHRLAPTYLGLKHRHVFHTVDLPDGAAGLETSLFLDDLQGGSFAVGEFEDAQGLSWVLVVNQDLRRSAPVRARFKQAGQVMRTCPFSGLTAPLGGEDGWLGPGQGLLLSLRPA